jgi:hypothetical protein
MGLRGVEVHQPDVVICPLSRTEVTRMPSVGTSQRMAMISTDR